MKESLAHCLSGPINLDEKDWERPVDRLKAIAYAQMESAHIHHSDHRRPVDQARTRSYLCSVGRDLTAYFAESAKGRDAPRHRRNAVLGVFTALRWSEYRLNLRKPSALLVATVSVDAAKDSRCKVCRGRIDKETGVPSIPDTDRLEGWKEGSGPIPMKPCPSCRGSGLRNLRMEEASLLGKDHKNLELAFSTAHEIIGEALYEFERITMKLLREWPV